VTVPLTPWLCEVTASPQRILPLYWGLMSVAAYKALFQLLRPSRRHYWELTQHGLVTEES